MTEPNYDLYCESKSVAIAIIGPISLISGAVSVIRHNIHSMIRINFLNTDRHNCLRINQHKNHQKATEARIIIGYLVLVNILINICNTNSITAENIRLIK